jgi:hypothetical protein
MDLKSLSDDEILKGTIAAAETERLAASQLLLWIQAVDDRKLYCDSGCESLFHFCLEALKLSEGSA